MSSGPRRETDLSDWDAAWRRRFRNKLLRWYRRQGRELPWRQTRDPYAIWVSEIMLQQTQVTTVLPFYRRFLRRFPDVGSLARARQQTVLRSWEGLGYYRRARQLHDAARQIMSEWDGRFPTDAATLQTLPGIGRYTAGAVLSFAYDQRLPILESNTRRLFVRLLALSEDPATADSQRRLWAAVEHVLPRVGVGQINQALMDLGSQVCRPSRPSCHECPVTCHCAAFQLGLQGSLPRKGTRLAKERLREAAIVICQNGHVLLRQCQPDERWAGLWDFPRFRVRSAKRLSMKRELAADVLRSVGCYVHIEEQLAEFRHGVTRFDINLQCLSAKLVSRRTNLPKHARWVRLDEIDQYPLNVTARRLGQLLQR